MKKLACIAAIASAALASPALAESNARAGFRISLTIPEICQLEASDVLIAQDGGSTTLNVFEMCNSGRGFRIVASHRPLVSGEAVQVNYAGQIRQLDSSGMSDLAHRTGPVVGTVPVAIQASGLVQTLAISLGLSAI